MPGLGDTRVNSTECSRGSSVPLCHVPSVRPRRPPLYCTMSGGSCISHGEPERLNARAAHRPSLLVCSVTPPESRAAEDEANPGVQLAAGLDGTIHSFRAHSLWRKGSLVLSIVCLRCRSVRGPARAGGKAGMRPLPLKHPSNQSELYIHLHSSSSGHGVCKSTHIEAEELGLLDIQLLSHQRTSNTLTHFLQKRVTFLSRLYDSTTFS